MAGMNVTGELDFETKKLFVIPRCGNTEKDDTLQKYEARPQRNKRLVYFPISRYMDMFCKNKRVSVQHSKCSHTTARQFVTFCLFCFLSNCVRERNREEKGRQADRQTHRDRRTGRHTHRQMDGRTDKETEQQRPRRTDRQRISLYEQNVGKGVTLETTDRQKRVR